MTRLIRVVPLLLIALIGSCALHDALVPYGEQIATRAAVCAIEQYRTYASPRMGRLVECRFLPTCSAYGLETIRRHGAYRGGWRAVKRIARCNPMTRRGTYDPP